MRLGWGSAIDLWNLAILPTAMYNAGTWTKWTDMSKEAMEMMEEWQYYFVRKLLRLPGTTPKPALLSEMGLLMMKFRVMKEKLMLIHHIRGMKETNNWPGLAREVRQICEELEVDDVKKHHQDKTTFKRSIEVALLKKHEEEVRRRMEGKSKMS